MGGTIVAETAATERKAMPPFIDVFLIPIRDNLAAQVMVEAVILLSGLDILMGAGSAWFITHDYKSAKLRAGLVKKVQNLGILAACSVLDTVLLVGVDLSPILPLQIPDGSIVVAAATAFVGMEVSSLIEIYAKTHPEVSDATWYKMLNHGKGGELDPNDTLELGRHMGGGQ